MGGLDANKRYIAGLAMGKDESLDVVDINGDTVYRLAGKPERSRRRPASARTIRGWAESSRRLATRSSGVTFNMRRRLLRC